MKDKEKKPSDTAKKTKKGSSSVCYMDEFPDYFGLEKEQKIKEKEGLKKKYHQTSSLLSCKLLGY